LWAAGIRAKRVAVMPAHRHWQWHLDEVCVKFNGVTHCLCRAFSGRLILRINRCSASPRAKAVALKADTTRSPLLPAWASRAAMTRHSGQWRAKAVVRVGRNVLRDALCRPAPIAARCTPERRQKHQTMIQAGKPAKAALTALIRRLTEMAKLPVRQVRKWTRGAA
jgi:hypothetical protein